MQPRRLHSLKDRNRRGWETSIDVMRKHTKLPQMLLPMQHLWSASSPPRPSPSSDDAELVNGCASASKGRCMTDTSFRVSGCYHPETTGPNCGHHEHAWWSEVAAHWSIAVDVNR